MLVVAFPCLIRAAEVGCVQPKDKEIAAVSLPALLGAVRDGIGVAKPRVARVALDAGLDQRKRPAVAERSARS